VFEVYQVNKVKWENLVSQVKSLMVFQVIEALGVNAAEKVQSGQKVKQLLLIFKGESVNKANKVFKVFEEKTVQKVQKVDQL
jgi:hypothetical protein